MTEWRAVILSARAENLVPCVHALLQHETALRPEDIIVVDDGARLAAERLLPGVTWVTGEKPFVFARNANIGIRAAGSADVLLLNDDARLVTPGGISRMAALMAARTDIGLCSAAVQGVVGNPHQQPAGTDSIRVGLETIAFVAVCIPRHIYERLGALDELFVGYGWEDNDYCARARTAGLACAVADFCVVDHSGALPSTFRTRSDVSDQYEVNRRLYERKALIAEGERPPMDVDGIHLRHQRGCSMTRQAIDLMFLAYNRLRFTQESFDALVRNTDWALVRELSVYDDGSVDGTSEWLEAHAGEAPVPMRFVRTAFGSPVSAMVHFIESAQAPLIAKIDNDTMVPPGWLATACGVFDRHPDLHFLGIEAIRPHAAGVVEHSVSPSRCISGLGLYRRTAFEKSRPVMYDRWHGFEEWQTAQYPPLRVGWIDPAIPVFLLDRCPFEPWRSLTDEYVRRGWQRPWDRYPTNGRLWEWRWPPNRGEIEAERSLPPGYQGFIGAMRIKNEASHIAEVLIRALALCERVFVFDDHSTDGTVEICELFGDRVVAYRSLFTGLDEARDKNFLLQRLIATNPRWVFWIDGDEILERSGAERLVHAADGDGQVSAFSLKIAYAWDDVEHIRVDGIYGSFFRPSLFRLESQPVQRLYFRATGNGGNFHCGNVPHGVIGTTSRIDVRLKHLGYVTAEQRLSKYQWYNAVDPGNSHEDYYRHLIDLPGARFASKSPEIVPWAE